MCLGVGVYSGGWSVVSGGVVIWSLSLSAAVGVLLVCFGPAPPGFFYVYLFLCRLRAQQWAQHLQHHLRLVVALSVWLLTRVAI